jgi:hypothetical protein
MPIMPERYSWRKFKRAVKNPKRVSDEMYRVLTNLGHQTIPRWQFEKKYGDGIDYIERDWDNLLVLDACRYDIFNEVNNLSGDVDFVISKGSHSEEFYKKNFSNRPFHDTVVVTANPYTPIVCSDAFYQIEATYSSDTVLQNKRRVKQVKKEDGKTVHASHIDNVHPKKVNQLAFETYSNHPNKRLIVHYMQPHDPYIGEKAAELRDTYRDEGFVFRYWDSFDEIKNNNTIVNSLMDLAIEGVLTSDELSTVYNENLEIVLEYIKHLIEQLEGKTVVTADHGELLGKTEVAGNRFYHPKNTYVKELRKVPWVTFNADDRRHIVNGKQPTQERIDDEELNKQLKLLGYKRTSRCSVILSQSFVSES